VTFHRDRHPLRVGAHVAEMWRPYLELGFTHLIADSPAPFDHETIERLPRLRALMAGA
jgi:hypothetical protein